MTASLVDLVTRAQSGDEPAFAALYEARVSAVFRYAKSILRDPTAAEDAMAQTFIQAWKGLPKLKDPERFDAWLFRIAHNVALNETRRRPTTSLEDAPEPVSTAPYADPEAFVAGKVDARVVREALLRLPDNLRDVLVLRFYAGLSHAEVAAQVGKTEQNVRVMQYRGLQRMRTLLDEQGFAVA